MHTGGVEPGIWGIVAVLVIGTAVVAYGWMSDRAADRRRAEAMQAPPEREIPRFKADEIRPQYLSELEAATRPDHLAATELGEEARARLTELLPGSPQFPAGWPVKDFVTDTATSWSVVEDPVIVICTDEVAAVRELLPAVKRAREAGRPLVVVAPGFAAEVLVTLRANWVQGVFSCLPVTLAGGERRSLGSVVGAIPVDRADLQAGYLPSGHLGGCHAWVSDQRASWVVLEGLK